MLSFFREQAIPVVTLLGNYRSIGTRRIDREFQMKRFMLSALSAAAAVAVTASAAVAASPTMKPLKNADNLFAV